MKERENLNEFQAPKPERSFVSNVKDIKDIIAPSGIDASSTRQLEIVANTSKFARTMMISTLPRMCTFPELLRGMYTFGDVNVSVFINPISESKSQNDLNKTINELESERIVAIDRGDINRESLLAQKRAEAEAAAGAADHAAGEPCGGRTDGTAQVPEPGAGKGTVCTGEGRCSEPGRGGTRKRSSGC